jgi:signal transduction protein with GAF and PtsI domain
MLKSIIEIFKAIFNDPVIKNDLERYITAGNPQNEGDVERLEREFMQQRKSLCRHYNG